MATPGVPYPQGPRRPWVRWVAIGLAAAFTLLAVVVNQRILDQADREGLTWIQAASPDWTAVLASVIDILGRAEVTIPLVLVWAGWQAWQGRPRRGVAIAAGFVLVTLLNPLVKTVVAQPPPDPSLARYAFDFIFPTAQADLSGAFPSGHASRVTYLLVVLALGLGATRWWWLVGIAVIVIAGWSRVVLGAHWLSDVGGGILLGAFLALVADALSWSSTDPVNAEPAGGGVPPTTSTPGSGPAPPR